MDIAIIYALSLICVLITATYFQWRDQKEIDMLKRQLATKNQVISTLTQQLRRYEDEEFRHQTIRDSFNG